MALGRKAKRALPDSLGGEEGSPAEPVGGDEELAREGEHRTRTALRVPGYGGLVEERLNPDSKKVKL
jgi:hypothetical protein